MHEGNSDQAAGMGAVNAAVSRGRLLVLDDEPDVCFTLCAIAATSGFETRSSTDADSFLEEVVEWHPTHLIIDLQMPDTDGIETLKALANQGCSALVIVTSGLGARVLEAAGRAAAENGLRVSGTLAKPFTPNRLRTLLLSESDDSAGTAAASPRGSSVNERDLADAIAGDCFRPHFQPKIRCDNGALAGFECLARWQHPELGVVMPDVFIPLAERSGHMLALTERIVDHALDWYTREIPRGNQAKLAINLSATMLADDSFSRWLTRRCREFDVHPGRIILEITESSSMDDPVAALEFLTQFRIKGFNLSIDDFGVGYSSLIQLARLPFSEMKIDKMFVMTAPKSEESQKIASAIVGLANALGINVCAEGVEDAWTLGFLRDIGCHTAQGYHIARPMDGDATARWLRQLSVQQQQ